MSDSGRLKQQIASYVSKVELVERNSSRSSLFEQEDETMEDVIGDIKEGLEGTSQQIGQLVQQGAKARTDIDIVKNIKLILERNMMDASSAFCALLEKRSQVVSSENRKSRNGTTSGCGWTSAPVTEVSGHLSSG